MPTRTSTVLYDGTLSLGQGEEWTSEPLGVEENGIVYLWAEVSGPAKVYAGVYLEDTYNRLRRQRPFPFPFGSDRNIWTRAWAAEEAGTYRLVLRLGVFNQAADVKLYVEVIGGPR